MTGTIGDFFPPTLLPSLAVGGIYLVLILLSIVIVVRLVDKLTPGDLASELLGNSPAKPPNIALAIFASAVILCVTLIILGAMFIGVH